MSPIYRERDCIHTATTAPAFPHGYAVVGAFPFCRQYHIDEDDDSVDES